MFGRAAGNAAAERFASLAKVFHFGAVFRRLVERGGGHIIVRDRNAKPRAEFVEFLFVQFFVVVGDVAAFAGFTEAIALDRFGKNDRGLAFVLNGGLKCGEDLFRIVTAATELNQFFVR